MNVFGSLTLLQDTSTPADPAEALDQAPDPGAVEPAGDATGLLENPAQLLEPDRAMELFETYGIPAIKAVVIILIALIIARWVQRLVIRSAGAAHIEVTLGKFLGNIARWAVLLIAAISILGVFGVETTSFAAVLAALGFAIGMALSGSLGNVASGVMLLIFRPFKVGDVVTVSGVTAKVDEIGLFATTLDTPDNRRFIIPNGSVFGSTIENISHHDTRRVDIGVGVEYGSDIDRVREVLIEAVKTVTGRREDLDHAIVLGDLGDSAVNWTVRIWVDSADYWAVKEEGTRAVKKALDDAGIGIPFPQMDVHLDGSISKD